jgi:hypothetical protein
MKLSSIQDSNLLLNKGVEPEGAELAPRNYTTTVCPLSKSYKRLDYGLSKSDKNIARSSLRCEYNRWTVLSPVDRFPLLIVSYGSWLILGLMCFNCGAALLMLFLYSE